MAKPVSYYAKKELKTLENQLDKFTQYGYGKEYQPIVNVLVNATKQMKEVYLNAVASERGTGPTESKHVCSMQKKKESLAKKSEAVADIDSLYAQEKDLLAQLTKKCEEPTRQVRSPEAFLDRWGIYEHDIGAINALLDAAEANPNTNITAPQFYEYYMQLRDETRSRRETEEDMLEDGIKLLQTMLKSNDVVVFNYCII